MKGQEPFASSQRGTTYLTDRNFEIGRLPNAAKRRKSGSPGRQPALALGSISRDETSREGAPELQILPPCGAGMYMHTQAQRLRTGLCSYAASRFGQPSDLGMRSLSADSFALKKRRDLPLLRVPEHGSERLLDPSIEGR